jgi:hypothetical protein
MNEEQLVNELKRLRSPHTLHIVYLAAIAIGLAIGAVAWRSSIEHAREDAHRDAVIEQSQHEIRAADDAIKGYESQLGELSHAAGAKISELQTELQRLRRDPAAARQAVLTVAGPAKEVQAPARADDDPGEDQDFPEAPSASKNGVRLDAAQTQKLAEELNACQQTSVSEQTCKLELALKDQILGKADEKVKAANDARDAALKASHGGSVWQRTWRVIRPVGCGGAGAGVGAIAAGPKGAMVGSVGAALACAILAK